VSDLERALRARQSEDLALSAARWLETTLWEDPVDYSLYHGLAGSALCLLEIDRHLARDSYAPRIARCGELLTRAIGDLEDASLYLGLTGLAFALGELGWNTGADEALAKVRRLYDGTRWNEMFELMMGNAGVALGALSAGDVELAVQAVEPYVASADPTAHGVNWAVRPTPSRSHHLAHGTLGIVYALCAVGEAARRDDFIELSLRAAADVVSRNVAGDEGFLVPHSDPPHRPDLIDRFSYGWCNGPSGDAQAFRLLHHVTGDSQWTLLANRCWNTVRSSGLPSRLYPGFWDNNGRCCGTAGVLALACDRIAESGDDFTFADLLVDDLRARATVDESGARWSNYEHRLSPPELTPRPGWAMGNAGIVRELLRYARLCRHTDSGYGVVWPDQAPTAPVG
jgi:hypothetical protein